ncbi:uncharacterized protein F4822DRAFT_224958 [Hypoxylon trugodes]|uniref:uncharacterized protein n=1 Tax=Hypoxylon trugodes TaxID=326681 RepID=UPI002197F748|nr:uncharacterized protein F4822DRAFT_224958 [Hypoxylon trugodes]KAI1390125.1 hypothetical protein F4822DRAFT_224958 [Hypoxylon trugodes]
MAITVAHELMHFFTGFLTGYDYSMTPEQVSYLPSFYNREARDGRMVGESGRAWEGNVLGGVVEAMEELSQPADQAGVLWVIDGQRIGAPIGYHMHETQPGIKLRLSFANRRSCCPNVRFRAKDPDHEECTYINASSKRSYSRPCS